MKTVQARFGDKWEPAFLVRRSGQWAWVKLTTRGAEVKVRATDVKEDE